MQSLTEFASYDGYRDSGVNWLGDIPKAWNTKPGLVAFTENKRDNKGMKEEQVLSLSYGKIIVKPKEKLVGLVPESFETYQIVEPGDIIIRCTDLQNDKVSLRTGIAEDKGIITSAYLNLKVNEGFSPRFLHYYLHSLDTIKVIYKFGSGLRQNLSFLDFKRLPIFDIPKNTQEAIANFLDQKTAQIDKAIAIKEKQIELLKERKQIIIQKAVTQGLDPNVPMKDSGADWIGKLPKHWSITRLKFHSNIQSGITLGKSYPLTGLIELPYLRVANVQFGYFKLNDVATLSIPKNEASRYLLKHSDILVTEGGDIDKLGRGTVWKSEIEPCIHQNHVFAIRINENHFSQDYVANYLSSSSARKHFISTATKTTNLASTSRTHLNNTYLPMPSLNEQEKINTFIYKFSSKTKRLISNLEEQISCLREYKTTLINSAVTGKIKVT